MTFSETILRLNKQRYIEIGNTTETHWRKQHNVYQYQCKHLYFTHSQSVYVNFKYLLQTSISTFIAYTSAVKQYNMNTSKSCFGHRCMSLTRQTHNQSIRTRREFEPYQRLPLFPWALTFTPPPTHTHTTTTTTNNNNNNPTLLILVSSGNRFECIFHNRTNINEYKLKSRS